MAILPCRPLSCSPPINFAAVTCDSCGETDPICCLKITRASWVEYVIVKRTGYTIGDSCSGTGATNACGNLSAIISTGGDSSQCFYPSCIAAWSNNAECDVMFSVTLPGYWSGGVFFPAKTFSGVVPLNWHESTLTLTSWDESESITVDVCDGTEEMFPPSDPDLMLKATLWVDTGAGLSQDIPAELFGGGMFDPPVNKYARGDGTTICGTQQTCEGDDQPAEAMFWYYERDSGNVRVTIATPDGAVSSTPSTADFAWSPTWADSGFTVPLASGVLGVGNTGEWRVAKVADCDDPGGCEPYDCYPLCVANTCPDDPETVNYSILFWHLECDGGSGEHSGQFDTPTEGSGGTYQAGDWPFTGTPSISCVGGVPTLDNVTLFGVDFDPISMTLECVDGEAVWTHTFVDPAGGGSGGGPGESCLLTIFTNNGGGA